MSTLCFKKVCKLCEMLNVSVSAGHSPTEAQEELAGWRHFSCFCLRSQILLKVLNSRMFAGGFVMGCAKNVLVLSIYKKVVEKSTV